MNFIVAGFECRFQRVEKAGTASGIGLIAFGDDIQRGRKFAPVDNLAGF